MSILGRHTNSSFAQLILHDAEDTPSGFDFNDRFESLWNPFSGLEDSNFWSAIDKDPDSKIWEMMTACLLKNEGYVLTSDDKGPDFCVFKNDSLVMHVEAVAPGPGNPEKNRDAVPELNYSSKVAMPVPEEQLLLRLQSAVTTKMEQHQKHIDKHGFNADTPFVIALGGIKLSPRIRGIKPPAALQALLGFGSPYTIIDTITGECVDRGVEYRPEIVKRNASSVSMTPFMSKDYSLLSGVLYSECSFWSLDFDLFRDSFFIQNPFAKNPLPATAFLSINHIWTIATTDRDQWKTFLLPDKERVRKGSANES